MTKQQWSDMGIWALRALIVAVLAALWGLATAADNRSRDNQAARMAAAAVRAADQSAQSEVVLELRAVRASMDSLKAEMLQRMTRVETKLEGR